MFIAKYYVGGALLSLLGAVFLDNLVLRILLLWISASLFAVSSAYIINKAGVFRKRQDGTIPGYIRWLFFPFLLGARAYNAWARKHDPTPSMQRIDNGLFLGCRLFPKDIERLKENGVTAVLDVTAEFDALDWTLLNEPIDYLNIPLLDHTAPSEEQCVRAINWMHSHIGNGGKVMVHCALGRGRSAFVVAAYMLSRTRQSSIPNMMEKIQGIRETVRLNKGQMAALEKLHRRGVLKIMNNAWIIANPVAGGGKWEDQKDEVINTLSPYFNITLKTTTETMGGGALAEQAIEDGADIIIAGGGDGTVSEVASKMVGSNIKLGILPLGTANALCHALWGIESKLASAEAVCLDIIEGHSTCIDTAQCNGKLMLLLAGIGFEQKMIELANRDEKDELGQLAYIQGFMQAVNESENFVVDMEIDDQPLLNQSISSVVIANAAPITSLLAQGGGEPDWADGYLDVTWIDTSEQTTERIAGIAELAVAGLAQIKTDNRVHHVRAKKIKLKTEPLRKYVIDGEVFDAAPLEIEVQPKSLHVLVPDKG